MSNTKTALKRESPPPRGSGYDWGEIAQRLRADPNEWHIVFEKDRASLAVAIKKGSIAALKKAKGFEVTTRENIRIKPRTCKLYMRYRPDWDKEN